jgi:hypothetical protein
MRGLRRAGLAALAAVGWWLVSCRDIPAPDGGVASISALLLPSPGLVVGDTMRDSIGVVAPLRVIAYGPDGDALASQPVAMFVALDTGLKVSGSFLIGERAGVAARVVGTVAALQTQPATVKVTLAPDTLVAVDPLRREYFIGPDTLAVSSTLGAKVFNGGTNGTPVEAVIVRYTVVHQPASSVPALVVLNGTAASLRDTSDGAGTVQRVAQLAVAALPRPLVTDSAIIDATASHRGRSLGTLRFIMLYRAQ